MDALQPNTRMLRRRLGASRRQAFKDWGSRDPVPHPHCLLRKCSPTNSTHTFWSSVASVSSSVVLFVWTSSENSHSCVVRCQGTSFGGVVAAAVLVAPPRFFQRFRFAFPTWFKRSLRASRDRSGVKGGASNFLLGTRRCGGFQLRTWWESPSHLHCSSTAVLNVQNSIACKIIHAQKLEPTMAKGEISDFSKQFTRCCNDDGLKSCSRSPYGSLCWSSNTWAINLMFCSAVVRVPRSLSLSSDGISNDGTLLMPSARQHDWTCLFASELQSG